MSGACTCGADEAAGGMALLGDQVEILDDSAVVHSVSVEEVPTGVAVAAFSFAVACALAYGASW